MTGYSGLRIRGLARRGRGQKWVRERWISNVAVKPLTEKNEGRKPRKKQDMNEASKDLSSIIWFALNIIPNCQLVNRVFASFIALSRCMHTNIKF